MLHSAHTHKHKYTHSLSEVYVTVSLNVSTIINIIPLFCFFVDRLFTESWFSECHDVMQVCRKATCSVYIYILLYTEGKLFVNGILGFMHMTLLRFLH